MTPLLVTSPVDGAIVHGDSGSTVAVTGRCDPAAVVTINGVPATRAGEEFRTEVPLAPGPNHLVVSAVLPGGRQTQTVRVFWDAHSFPRYRVAIDDNIYFLRELVAAGCDSLFDHFYLAGLQRLHQRFGARFLLNLFFSDGQGFDLTMVPERYRNQWRDNAHWLKLAFHARTEGPDRPYEFTEPGVLLADMQLVEDQIRRFAGAALAPLSVVHWATMRPELRPLLAQRGVRCLGALFRMPPATALAYQLPLEQVQHAAGHEGVVDFDSGIVFSKIDLIVNSTALPQIEPNLAAVAAEPARAQVMDILTHEQYFYPFYQAYLPDHFQRLETTVRWLSERGYQCVFFHDGFLGAPWPGVPGGTPARGA